MASPTLPSPHDRRRRRRLRLIPIIGYTIVALALGYFLGERPSTTVIFVRHAETDVSMADADSDPPLNARGRQRAELLGRAVQLIGQAKRIGLALVAAGMFRLEQVQKEIGGGLPGARQPVGHDGITHAGNMGNGAHHERATRRAVVFPSEWGACDIPTGEKPVETANGPRSGRLPSTET